MHPPPAIDRAALPRHVAFIMDGNGRWAQQRGLPRTEGHRRGVEAVRSVLECSRDWGIHCVSLYAFSTENWKRPEEEINVLFSLLLEYLEREIDAFVRDEVRLHVFGDLDGLPSRPRASLLEALERTAHLDKLHCCLCINYGGRDEILRALRRWAADANAPAAADLDEAAFAAYLDSAGLPDPDLMIRTSGEQRLSNFLLWQLAYTEFLFVPEAWPDFTPQRYAAALEQYAGRIRRFGKTTEQVKNA